LSHTEILGLIRDAGCPAGDMHMTEKALGWTDCVSRQAAITTAASCHCMAADGADMRVLSLPQIAAHEALS